MTRAVGPCPAEQGTSGLELETDGVATARRYLSGIKGMLPGSVSQAVLHHAPCPIAVVRPH